MIKADWVILRLLKRITTKTPSLVCDPEIMRSLHYLYNKYGQKHFYECIDALNATYES